MQIFFRSLNPIFLDVDAKMDPISFSVPKGPASYECIFNLGKFEKKFKQVKFVKKLKIKKVKNYCRNVLDTQ